MAAEAGWLGQRPPDAGGGGELILRLITAEHRPNFKQPDIGETAISVLLRGGDETWNKAWPHVGQLGRNRIGQRQLRLAAAEQLGLRFGDERPRHRLDQVARAERPLGLARAHLDRRQHRLAWRVAALERRQRHAVDADDAHDFFDHVGFVLHVGTP